MFKVLKFPKSTSLKCILGAPQIVKLSNVYFFTD